MAWSSSIEWTNSTWNPLTGCTKLSPGCANCYAERMAKRLKAMGNPSYSNGFTVSLHENALELPLKWKKPQRIFVNSMSDLFHKDVPDEFIFRVFDVMGRADWHLFQVLTKRTQRLMDLSPKLQWKSNIWMGVSIEDQFHTFRIDHLRNSGSKIKFLSIEPLLGPIPNLSLQGIDWVIVGGESGPKSRKMQPSWAIDIRDHCLHANVPFYFKQWGGPNKKRTGRLLEGRIWDQMPFSNKAFSSKPLSSDKNSRIIPPIYVLSES